MVVYTIITNGALHLFAHSFSYIGGLIMKKIVSLVLVLMFMFSFCACGKAGPTSTLATTPTAIPSSTPTSALATTTSDTSIQESMMRYCRECGKELPSGSKFCPYCGTPVTFEEQSAEKETTAVTVDNAEENPIAGTWEAEIMGVKLVYVFNSDGTYENFAQLASIQDTYGTYAFDGEKLILNSNDGVIRTIKAKVTGNRLFIKGKMGENEMDTIFSRVDGSAVADTKSVGTVTGTTGMNISGGISNDELNIVLSSREEDNNGYDFSEWSDPEDAYQELTKLYIKDDESIAKAEELFSILPADYKDVATYKQTFDFYKPFIGMYRSNDGDRISFRIRYVKQEDKFAAIIGGGRNGTGGYDGIFEYPELSTIKRNNHEFTIINDHQINRIYYWSSGDGNSIEEYFKENNSASSDSQKQTSSNSSARFTNAYGTPTTKCAHNGCNNYIASSGDTNCCTIHSKRCLNCGKYIDEDATFCMSCISKSINSPSNSNSNKNGSSSSSSNSSGKTAKCNYCNGTGYADGGKCPWCGGSGKTYDSIFNDLLG